MTDEPASARAVVQRLSAHIDAVLDPIIRRDAPFALLDFPDHDNLGDSAIFVGNLRYFDNRRMRPNLVSRHDNVDWKALDRLSAEGGDIYLHGGGNFGDLWPCFQPFREEVLRRFPGRRVIQLPQTLHYRSQERIDQTARVIEAHGTFTLLVRDQPSYDLARRAFQCDVQLCPDMAFQIGSVKRSVPATHQLLLHLRADQEAKAAHDVRDLEGRRDVRRSDWPIEPESWGAELDRRARIARLPLLVFRGKAATRGERYRARAEARFARGIALLSDARYVVTDRMHGHILCLLLGLPHAVLDNSYGKISGFMSAWGTDAASVHMAASVAQGVEALQREGLKLAPD